MTLFTTNPEREAWDELPCFIKASNQREAFDRALLNRAANYEARLREQITFGNQTQILASGDWHFGKCSFVAKDENHTMVIKPRDTKIDQYLGQLINKISKALNLPLRVPEIKEVHDLSHQSFIKKETYKHDINYAYANLAALCAVYGIYDLHQENVIESKDYLNIIDLDCAFYSFRGIRLPTLIDRSGVFYSKNNLFKQSLAFKHANILNIHTISRGFATTVRQLVKSDDFTLTNDVDEILLRRVLLNTRIYQNFLKKRYAFGWTDAKASEQWSKLRTNTNEEIINSEITQLLSWDIPVFYQRGKQVLCGSSKKTVDITYSPFTSINRRIAVYRKKAQNELYSVMHKHLAKFQKKACITYQALPNIV